MPGKIIVLDWSIFLHRAVFASKFNRNVPPTYTHCSMILSALRKIGVRPEDKIIVALDDKKNWRKELDSAYKADRKEKKEESGLDWQEMYRQFAELEQQIDMGTNWNLVRVNNCEADDIASVCCRHFNKEDVVLVSYDEDWQQLLIYPKVKIFSILKKYKSQKGAYLIPKPSFNPFKLIAKKIEKEKTDNLISPILSSDDYEKRKMLVDLLHLPPSVEYAILESLQGIRPKEGVDIDRFPFRSLRERLANLFTDNSSITYEDCLKAEEKKKLKKKLKKGDV